MSLDRKDLRVYFSPELHAALLVLANAKRIEPAKLAERVIEEYVVEMCHEANVISSDPAVAGLNRIRQVSSGSARSEPVLRGRGRA
jgi:hypothetical protein